jgi:chloride channel protein, CIC family
VLLGILLVKSTIWAVSLGSGTSGGVLAPLLMMGGALGGIEAMFLPDEGAGFWPLVSMGAILGGTMRSPLTGIVFALELTHDVNVMLPLLVASVIAHGFTVLVLKRSILTEKVSRRGYHLTREYSIDPLEVLFVREVMQTNIAVLPADVSIAELARALGEENRPRTQRLYPVVAEDRTMVGVVTRKELHKLVREHPGEESPLAAVIKKNPVVAYPDEPLRVVVYRMAEASLTRFPVVKRAQPQTLIGVISLSDLLAARARNLEEERRRERVLRLHLPFPRRARTIPEDYSETRQAG